MSRHHRLDEGRLQPPTCTGIRIRSVLDAHLIFHGVMMRILPMVTRRLDTDERRMVRPGNVYVWEERGRHSEATGLGIERWTDGIRWSASRVRDEFLLYHERDTGTDLDFSDVDTLSSDTSLSSMTIESRHSLHNRLVKQTYSVFVDTTDGRKKWHLTAYFVPSTVNHLRTVDDMPQLTGVDVPDGMYISAKIGKGRAREAVTADIHGSAVGGAPHMVVSRPYISLPQQYSAYVAYSNENMQTPSPVSSNGSLAVQTQGPLLRPLSHWSPPRADERDAIHRQSISSRTLPRIVPPSGLSPASPTTGGYSPRHPADTAALLSFNRAV